MVNVYEKSYKLFSKKRQLKKKQFKLQLIEYKNIDAIIYLKTKKLASHTPGNKT